MKVSKRSKSVQKYEEIAAKNNIENDVWDKMLLRTLMRMQQTIL